jgi:hypothetical protein
MPVIAYHLIWTNYGTWLPNDLRGSGSRSVYTPILAELGEAHFGRKVLQPARSKVRAFYEEAEPLLQFPVLRWNAEQLNEIGDAFSETIRSHQYTCYACAILADHVHVVIRKHKHDAETMIENVQNDSRARIVELGIASSTILAGPGTAGGCSWMRPKRPGSGFVTSKIIHSKRACQGKCGRSSCRMTIGRSIRS